MRTDTTPLPAAEAPQIDESDWRPGATAPRDGTVILARAKNDPEIEPFKVLYDRGWFHAEWPNFETWFDEWMPVKEEQSPSPTEPLQT